MAGNSGDTLHLVSGIMYVLAPDTREHEWEGANVPMSYLWTSLKPVVDQPQVKG